MTISRFDPTLRADGTPYPGAPVISLAVTHGDLVYLSGIADLGDPPGNITRDVGEQAEWVLGRVDELLAKAGTDKSKILTTQLLLRDMSTFPVVNDVWNAWVDRANPPARSCFEVPLPHPDQLVELVVTAARG